MPIAQASSWHAPPRPLVDLQATDQVTLESKAPLQLGGATGEVAGDAASHEVALLTDALGAAHLGGVLVLGRRTFPPASDLGGAVVGLIPTCTLRGHSKMGKIGHGVKKLRVVLKSLQLVTQGINHGIKRGKDTVRKSFFP